jgi:hypothetical protein
MGEERVAFEGLNDRHYPIVASNAQVIALGNIVGQHDSRGLADSRENSEQHAAFQGLRLIDNHKGVVE